jgi:hypothetical protein
MAFIAKHLPGKFYLDGTQRVSLRSKLFREVVSNLLIHREFANRFPAKLIMSGKFWRLSGMSQVQLFLNLPKK